MVGDELRVIQMISAAMTTMKASPTGTHRAPRRERLAGRTAPTYQRAGEQTNPELS